MGTCMSNETKNVTLVMVGLDNAGKTTTTKGLIGESPENVAPTLGFSSFQLKHCNFHVTIYDLGGSKSIRGIWRNYLAEAYGFIFVIDASDSNRVQECREVLHSLLKNPIVAGKPFLILANKQDIVGAMDEIEICGILDIESLVNEAKSRTRVETCSALTCKSRKPDKPIQAGFRWLLTTIGIDYVNLKQKVAQDVAIQKAVEEKERHEREERVRKLREEREKQECNNCDMHDDDGDGKEVVEENPFKPITILVKRYKDNETTAQAHENQTSSQADVAHQTEQQTNEPIVITETEKQCELNHANDDVNEENSLSSTPHRTFNHNLHDLPNGDPKSRVSSQCGTYKDISDKANAFKDSSVAIIYEPSLDDRYTVVDNNLEKNLGSISTAQTTESKNGADKRIKCHKMMVFRHNKTAPLANEPLASLPGKLPPLLINTTQAVQWAKFTPQKFSEAKEHDQPSDYRLNWELAEELLINKS